MSAFLKYTLARLGLFVLVAILLLVVPIHVSVLLKLMIALLVSAPLAFFLLKDLREEASVQAVEKRERLRAALNGDDDGGESATKAD